MASRGSFSQLGPSHHNDSVSSSAPHPLDGRSAGFRIPAICFQSSGFVSRRISCTLLFTNVPQFSLPIIQYSTFTESDQQQIGTSSSPKSDFVVFTSRDPMVQAKSSNLGIVIAFIGATLARACTS
ncbi:hypothetical protein AVEN_181490-1 [Araneus ventricosus]|uniref:Uncharacterized protein n=1 Tax=Araneus ventricosus TaxID=182803 RepID=A0A4Y2F1W3_ARAVE|nr:hypothetical protein AVEN_181490-1 [Araneus ventricosus]